MKPIVIKNAYHGNLKNISLSIPRNQLIVVTGISGSGKSTLLIDVLYMECQRKYLEAMSFQGIRKPNVDEVLNAGAAIVISQDHMAKNPRSTVGTLTDIYTGLRMIFEKLGQRECPFCHQLIKASECKEEVVKNGDDFEVYMYCSECGHKMRKLTKTEFSFNTKEGACKTCDGLGTVLDIDEKKVINLALSLEDGAVDFWDGKYKEYQIASLYAAYQYYELEVPYNKPVKDYSQKQKDILYLGVKDEPLPKTVAEGRFEGVYTTIKRRYEEKAGTSSYLNQYFSMQTCPECHGERLNRKSAKVTVQGVTLPQVNQMSLEEILNWITSIQASLSKREETFVKEYLLDIQTKCSRLMRVGLGYLCLDRQMATLSGGELQRIKLSALLDADLVGMIYILDEPTSGLHPKDIEGLIEILIHLRDLGNTVVVIEHDPDVMKVADDIIDIGPGSGRYGGEVVASGKLEEIISNKDSLTGQYLKNSLILKTPTRPIEHFLTVQNASKFNLKNLSVKFPLGVLCVVTGPSGSGKSTLVLEELAPQIKEYAIIVQQAPLTRQKRSNVATYCGFYTEIRHLFGKLEEAKKAGLTAKSFSFNHAGGRCENCVGLGVVPNHLLFFENNEVTCPVCHGKRFKDEILQVKWHDLSIHDVLSLSVKEAIEVFQSQPKILEPLQLLSDVGLDYLELGQVLTTLSSGEGQRLKLARELMENKKEKQIYLLDEPTRGLHPHDITHFAKLLNKMVDQGHTVIVIEHNLQLISQSDWIIDLGPSGGNNGGELIFEGIPQDFIKNKTSVTAKYLKKEMGI